MPPRYLTATDGSKLRVLDVDGYFIPTFPIEDHEKHYRSMASWKARPDDVMVCAYPKAGTHWLWEVVIMILRQKAERVKVIKETAMLEGITESTYDNQVSPRVFNSHIYFKFLPKDFREKKCKIVFIVRNPKDIAVSFYNHHSKIKEYEFEGKWEEYLSRFLEGSVDYGSWFDYTAQWEKDMKENPDYPFHIINYEDMKENGLREIKRLANFFGCELSESVMRSIDDLCQFDKMKKDKDPLEDASEWKDNNPGMYRKGQVGDWKNWFTVGQNEMFDSVYNEKMKNLQTKVRFTLHD